MQSNGNAVPTSESKPSITDISPTKEKKIPPKSPKRVSFDLNDRTIILNNPSSFETSTTKVVITSSNTAIKETSNLNGALSINKSNDTVVEQVNTQRKNSDETKGDGDKNFDKSVSSTKVNIDICDTSQSKVDNEIRSKIITTEKNESIVIVNETLNKSAESPVTSPTLSNRSTDLKSPTSEIPLPIKSNSPSERLKQDFVKSNENSVTSPTLSSPTFLRSPTRTNSTSERLRQEFVKSNESPVTSPTWNRKSSSFSIKSPDLSSRLTESQSKIAKLQQSLPTKLSDATVESLKNKYSPASFGYPRSLNKSPELSKIPSYTSKIARSASLKTEEKVFPKKPDRKSSISEEVHKNIKDSTTVVNINTASIKTEKRLKFRSELHIPPSRSNKPIAELEKEIKSDDSKLDCIDKDKTTQKEIITDNEEVIVTPKVKTKFISSEIFPKEQVSEQPLANKSDQTSLVKLELPLPKKVRPPVPEKPKPLSEKLKPEIVEEILKKPEQILPEKSDQQEKEISIEPISEKLDEILPDKSEKSEQIIVEKSDISEDQIDNEDTSEQSSDTITESEDSQNIKYRKIFSDKTDSYSPSRLSDAENNNISKVPDPDTSSNTSEVTYCEVIDAADIKDEMEEAKKKPQKKRSNSFKRIFGFGSSKDKKKNEETKNTSKNNTNGLKKNEMLSDNAQNEANIFDRNSSQRHTIGGQYNSRDWERRTGSIKENVPCEPFYSNTGECYQQHYQQDQYYNNSRLANSVQIPSNRNTAPVQNMQGNIVEDHLNQIKFDLYLAQQTNQQLNSNLPVQQRNVDEYVCMDNPEKSTKPHLTQPGFINAHSVDKYIDTTSSSSISTLESENRNIIYENTVKSNNRPAKVQNTSTKIPVPTNYSSDKNINKDSPSPSIGEKFYERPKFADSPEIFIATPRRAQGPQLIKPKAIIPINTERALPNPYRGVRDPQQSTSPDNNIYGNLPSPDNSKQSDTNLNDIKKQYPNKETVYGKPVPASRRAVPGNDATYGNISNSESTIITVEDDYGTVYDSLTPVGAQLVVSKPQIISGVQNMEKRSRSVSPSQRHKATSLSSSQSFSYKNKPQVNPVSPTSPNRREVEAKKLHLPSKRETTKPRLKSPIEDRRNQAKKTSESNKKDSKNNIPSHQNLEIEIDYPDNNLNESQDRKETPEKFMFTSNENVPTSPKRQTNIKRSAHVSPNRPKSFTHSTPKSQSNDCPSSDTGYSEISRATNLRSPVAIRSESPASVSSSLSLSSISNKSKPMSTQDLKDLKNTEVYFYEQTTNKSLKKDDASPDQSPQQVLTQATVHQPKSSPRKVEPSPTREMRHTPVNPQPQIQSKVPISPQKQQNLQNVEAFYWQQLKKLKEKEEQEIYNQHIQMMARQHSMSVPPEYANQHRSRSITVGPNRSAQRRSTSLPRDARPPSSNQRPNQQDYGYGRTGRQYSIPEGVIVEQTRLNQIQQLSEYSRQSLPIQPQNNNFVRGSPQRSTVGPINTQKRNQLQPNDVTYENYFPGVELRHQAKSAQQGSGYAPIFKRGSLTPNPITSNESPPLQNNKKVSFSSAQDDGQTWPTKNGFTQSPPTRRVDKRLDSLDDDVFFSSKENMKNVSQQFTINYNLSKEPTYGTNKSVQNSSRDPIYVQSVASGSGIDPVYVQREPIYGKTTGNKQITMTNKVCDMYGQIHEVPVSPQKIYGHIQKTGVIYGQLQPNPLPGSPLSMRNQCLNRSDPSFVRGGRLTASFNDMRSDAPRRPLPPIPGPNSTIQKMYGRVNPPVSESESGSEAGEVQRILAQKEKRRLLEEEWNSDSKSGRSQSGGESGRGGVDGDGEVRSSRSARSGRRDDPRRHTLSGSDPHYPAGMAVQGGPLSRTMDLEVPMPRGYPPPSSAMLFDDDPGIMSEVETSSTGFRRGGKQRSSLPVVRTPSKTLERPLGLVFLQYRNETKRALLPNEITSIDTVKALFVRSFPKQLTMEYLDSPLVKIYIHDSSKDMFYELEDLRSHLRDIRDRSVLRLFESADVSGGLPGPGTGISGGVGHFEDQSYFSEPEFDSEYQHQHIHKSKTSGAKAAPPYYMGSTTLPRGGPLLRAYSPAIGGPIPADRLKTLPAGAPPKPLRSYSSGGGVSRGSLPDRYNTTFHSQADLRLRSDNPLFSMPDRIHTDGYMSSPERGSRGQYEDPYYSQYAARSGSITPVIDEEASDTELLDESYSLYGVKLPPPGGPRAVPAPRTQFSPAPTAVPYDATRLRVENMERQLANLTGLVQKALHQTPPSTREFLQVPGGRDSYRPGDEFDKHSSSSSASLPDKSVSFEKSVSFSDEPPDMNSPKQHSPQHTADTKPPKPAIKSSTLPRTSSQERDRLKPAPPPKPASLSPAQYDNSRHIYRDLQLTPEMYNQLRGLQKKAKDLRTEVRNLRRLSQAQAHSVRETIRDTFIKIRAMLLASGDQVWQAGIDQEKVRLSREEDLYKQEMIRLEKDLTELEATVEELRGNVINRKTRVNMSDVENMALILSKSSKTVADLKLRFPGLQDAMKSLLTSEMEKVVREEKFLKEEPERLESALRRCKKLTGTLVTLKRLASVQEQRLPCSNSTNDGRLSPTLTETPPITPPSAQHSKPPAVPTTRTVLGQSIVGGDSTGSSSCDGSQRPENALDALLDELQTFSKPHPVTSAPAPSTVTTQLPQAASYKVPGSGTPSMGEIGRKGSMDSATLLPVQNLTVSTATGSLRRLHSYPSGSDTDNSPPIQPLARGSSTTANKPPIPERNAELLQHLASGRRVPPPPPPRTSSKSPLASPTSPSLPPRSTANQNALQHIQNVQNMTDKPQSQFEAATQNLGLGTLRRNVPGRSSLKEKSQTLPRNIGSNLQVQMNSDGAENKLNPMSTSNSSSCESVNSQEGAKKGSRKEELEQRHQELLKKQKALQEQYARLQQLQRGNNTLTVVPPAPDLLLKKTGSESNLLQKMGLQMAAPQQMTGSLTHLANASLSTVQQPSGNAPANNPITSESTTAVNSSPSSQTTTAKVYETDIL